MPTLTVPAPDLVLDPPAGPPALEKPVNVRLAAPRAIPTAAASPESTSRRSACSSTAAPAAHEEVWDEASEVWTRRAGSMSRRLAAAHAASPVRPAPGRPGGPWDGHRWSRPDRRTPPGAALREGRREARRRTGFAPSRTAARDGRGTSGVSGAVRRTCCSSARPSAALAVAFDTETPQTPNSARLLLKNAASRRPATSRSAPRGGQRGRDRQLRRGRAAPSRESR